MSNLGPQFDRAQRAYDNAMPPEDPPEPDYSDPCPCGGLLSLEQDYTEKFYVRCIRCNRQGPMRWWKTDAVEAWNDYIDEILDELRKEK